MVELNRCQTLWYSLHLSHHTIVTFTFGHYSKPESCTKFFIFDFSSYSFSPSLMVTLFSYTLLFHPNCTRLSPSSPTDCNTKSHSIVLSNTPAQSPRMTPLLITFFTLHNLIRLLPDNLRNNRSQKHRRRKTNRTSRLVRRIRNRKCPGLLPRISRLDSNLG